MNKRYSDFDLLREFARDGRQSAFASLVRQHLDLVIATALRKVEDRGGAEEIAQNVFSALARKAWQFAPDDSLPAWLHKAALLESKSWLRGELRRRRREQTAADLGTTMRPPENQSAFQQLVPLLDEALLSLREKDRTALLLRYCERQSLLDVGVAFGVSEGTAQKRVQSALEKLSLFFKRRGFKTATVAATIAALQHTATSTSATVVSTVVSAALQAAPPTLVGLGALLKRLAGMSRVQTAAVCVALAAAPLSWQLNERHTARAEVKRFQTQLLAAQMQGADVQTEIERLRASSGRLEQSLAQANETAARAAESAQAFDAWKKKTRARLAAADYQWDDDSPFVRIPKAILPELMSAISADEPFSSPGVAKPYARELLALAPSERATVEATLQRHFADVEARLAAGLYETNQPSRNPFPKTAVAGNVFIIPRPDEGAKRLDDEAKQLADQLITELRGILGEERWPLVEARLKKSNTLNTVLRGAVGSPCEVRVWVETDDKGARVAVAIDLGVVIGTGYSPLSAFLPAGDPNKTDEPNRSVGFLSQPLRQRVQAWAQEQAIARLGNKEKP